MKRLSKDCVYLATIKEDSTLYLTLKILNNVNNAFHYSLVESSEVKNISRAVQWTSLLGLRVTLEQEYIYLKGPHTTAVLQLQSSAGLH